MKRTPGAHMVMIWLVLSILLGVQMNSFSTDENPRLLDTLRSIENCIDLYVANAEYRKILEVTGEKFYLRNAAAIINKDTFKVSDFHTRGNTTLHLRRKSFSIQLDQNAKLYGYGKPQESDEFYAISLSMDKYYFRNRISFGMLREIQLFDLFFSFSEFRMNDETQGIYLLLERPQDWALLRNHSPCIIRRGFDQKIEELKSGKGVGKAEVSAFRKQFKSLYKALNKYEGQALYDTLSQWIDLEMYMKWLAFNYYLYNGDYTDEIYFYPIPGSGRFRIIPWDYDDVFASQPHEGSITKLNAIGHKLLYSSEDKLDMKIASDPFLYDRYLNNLHQIMKSLTPNKIRIVFENAYAELYPYYRNEKIIGMSIYDEHPDATLENMKSDMLGLFQKLILRRTSILNYLERDQ